MNDTIMVSVAIKKDIMERLLNAMECRGQSLEQILEQAIREFPVFGRMTGSLLSLIHI